MHASTTLSSVIGDSHPDPKLQGNPGVAKTRPIEHDFDIHARLELVAWCKDDVLIAYRYGLAEALYQAQLRFRSMAVPRLGLAALRACATSPFQIFCDPQGALWAAVYVRSLCDSLRGHNGCW
jgi:hypothetical protein